MPQRLGRPGLLGTMARTAVISGTATAVSGNVARRQQRRAQPPPPQEQQHIDSQVAPPPPSGGHDLMAALQRLADLKSAGLLSDAEFAASKAKLLA